LLFFIIGFVALLTFKILEDLHIYSYHPWWIQVGVPGFAGICCLYSLLNYRYSDKRHYFIVIALFFAMVAEIINACDLSFGLLFFTITHICLTIFHWKKSKKFGKFEIISMLIFIFLYILIVSLLEYYLFYNFEHFQPIGTPKVPPVTYVIVIPVYMFVLSLMAWRSICTFRQKHSGRIIVGSLLFYLCDIFILAELASPWWHNGNWELNFQDPPIYLLVLSWITYLPSLFLLSCIDQQIFINKKYKWF
ncbi:MAG: lysoplasmalogenase, partial [Mycoplasmataceae bacterium]|nr:lysoplasmalogenase [Mycoplasmataceae bacterium]